MDLRTIDDVVMPTDRVELPAGGEDTAVIAGGTWLMSERQTHLRRLVDITGMGWPPVTVGDTTLDIASTCTIAQLTRTPLHDEWTAGRLFPQCATALLASYKIWSQATVGGNIALALPAGSMISLATALDGVALVWCSDGRDYRLAVEDLVTGPKQTALGVGDILRSIEIPLHALRARTAFRKTSLSPLGRSAAVVIGRVDSDGRTTVSVTASTVMPFVLRFDRLPTPDEIEHEICTHIPSGAWYDDPHGSPDWREHITRRSARDIVEELS